MYKPHIIHGAVFEGVTMASISGFLGRVPIRIIEETSDPQNRSWRGNLLLRMLAMLVDYVVGISPSVVEYLKSDKIPPIKLRLINNGVEFPDSVSDEAEQALRTKYGIKKDDFVVGSVGRLRDFHKRFSDLIKATSILKQQQIHIKLLIVGDGNDMAMLRQLAVDENVEDEVIFAGFQFITDPFYKIMDVFALASHMEGFGLVVVEAMFFKLPVVATAVGGMREIVIQNETGYLIPSHSPESIADKLSLLFRDRHNGKLMGEKGYQRALQEYTAEAYTKKVAALYEEAVNRKRVI